MLLFIENRTIWEERKSQVPRVTLMLSKMANYCMMTIQNVAKTCLKTRPFVLGIMAVYNEVDIVEQVVRHMRAQYIPLVVIDNGSTDGSFDLLKRCLSDGIVQLSRIETDFFELEFLLRALYTFASVYEPEWILVLDADAFFESPSLRFNLKEAISREGSKGHNLIQFNNFEFWPTEKDQTSTEPDVRKKLRYYSWNDNWQFRCFKNYPGTSINETGGHLPIFPLHVRVNLSPEKFVLRHYPIRSYKQGLKKVFEDRLPRYSKDRKRKWVLPKYFKFGREERFFVIESSKLTRYNDDGKWCLERKFDGHRGYELPNLNSSSEIETEMENHRKTIGSTGPSFGTGGRQQ